MNFKPWINKLFSTKEPVNIPPVIEDSETQLIIDLYLKYLLDIEHNIYENACYQHFTYQIRNLTFDYHTGNVSHKLTFHDVDFFISNSTADKLLSLSTKRRIEDDERLKREERENALRIAKIKLNEK